MSLSLSSHAKACAQVGAPLIGAAIGLGVTALICGVGHKSFNGPDASAGAFAQAAQSGYAASVASSSPSLVAQLNGPAAWARPARGHDLDCLSEAVYYEARGESPDGQAAVAQVVLNRARNPGYPKGVCAVVFQPRLEGGCQFSFVCDGAMARPLEPAAWRQARVVASRALGGYVMTAVGRALNFHVAPADSDPDAKPGTVAHLGRHVFFVALTRPWNARRYSFVRQSEPAPSDTGAASPEVTHRVTMALDDLGLFKGTQNGEAAKAATDSTQ